MSIQIPLSEALLAEMQVLVEARHPLWVIESAEEHRLEALLEELARRVDLPYLSWTPVQGLLRHGPDGGRPAGTESLEKCLAFIDQASFEGIFHLKGLTRGLDSPEAVARLSAIYRRYFRHRGTVVLSGASIELPPDIAPLASPLDLPAPTPAEIHRFVSEVLRDLARTRPVTIELDGVQVSELLSGLHGLSYFEIHKIISRAVAEDGKLSRDDLPLVFEAKRRIIERSGVLEYFPHAHSMGDVAGLTRLKTWLRKRHGAFLDPERAAGFGLEPPKGLLLIGVQGCGKSLCAKAVASEWKLPLVRLDPSNLYQKYFGESEKNLRRAITLAESMAPVVLWIDEIEKALGQGGDHDGGTSQRVFGTFLAWMQEKKANVFVIATANDIAKLPPELLRKGRFDEIFFVDLPDALARTHVLEVHLHKRGRDPADFDLPALAEASEGFSGAELEQAVIAGLYTAFDAGTPFTTETILDELAQTRPLSVTMAEKVAALRAWAKDRAVRAD